MAHNNSGQGFAGMSEKEHKAASSKGGRSQGKENNPANLANRPKEEIRKIASEGGFH